MDQPRVQVEEHRLPLDAKPVHYDLVIQTDLEALNFAGTANINLEVLKPTSTLIFHSSSLNYENISVHVGNEKGELKPSGRSYDQFSERMSLEFDHSFPAGSKIQLRTSFNAALTGAMAGYYYSTWERDGKTAYYALTQFESTAARRAFPCWDEPLLKATYTITLISRADTVNLSNMPAISEEPYEDKLPGEWKITKFEITPLVSSYLIAFANGDFKYIEDSYTSPLSGRSRPLRVYTTSDHIHQAQFALDVKRNVLPIYEQSFGLEFPLPKLDTLVVNDFDFGAMENWGLITGRTSSFLIDPANSSVTMRKEVASIMCHEVAHMWFGNITTMAWWDNLYLNEGFATLMGEVIILAKAYPEWTLDSEFITGHLNRALSLDAKLSSHPIEVECPDARHISQIFDELSYSKAGSVLRMLSAFVGEEKFLKGISIYLNNHLYSNTVTQDLWDGISEASGYDVASLMDNWVTKMGFAVITVKETMTGIIVRQDRFLETGPTEDKDNETIWHIPLNIIHEGPGGVAVFNPVLLKEREMTIELDTNKPFKLNAGTAGVYRVLYTPERLQKIGLEAAKGESLFSLNDRIGLVHDAFSLSSAGFGKVSSALGLVRTLIDEKDYLVWQGIQTKIGVQNGGLLHIASDDANTQELLHCFSRHIYAPVIARLGMVGRDDDSSDNKELRSLAIAAAANSEDENVISFLLSKFDKFLKTGDDEDIPADLEATIYICAGKHGGRKEYDAFKQIYLNPKTPSQKVAAGLGMCAAPQPELLEETFQFILNGVRDQDVSLFFSRLGFMSTTRRQVAHFFKTNYDTIYERFSNNNQLNRLVAVTFKYLTTEEDARDLEDFFRDKDVSKFNMSLQQTIDTIRANVAFFKRSIADISEWLQEWQKTTNL